MQSVSLCRPYNMLALSANTRKTNNACMRRYFTVYHNDGVGGVARTNRRAETSSTKTVVPIYPSQCWVKYFLKVFRVQVKVSA